MLGTACNFGANMLLRHLGVFSTLLLIWAQTLIGANIGLLVMATGKYIQFVPPLLKSAEEHFCKGHQVTYFVFTDGTLPPSQNIVTIFQHRLGWPFDTMMRFEVYAKHRSLLESQDYLFACDADMLFVDTVGDEILSERVATQHPGFVNKRGSYETRPISTACVYDNEGEYYFAGGFYGGSAKAVLEMAETNVAHINEDFSRGIIAVWHDESHLNRFFIDHTPTLILSPSYCYPESWKLPYQKRLLALDKNHNEVRE